MIEPGSLIRSLSGRPAARNYHSYVLNEIGHGIVTGKFPIGSVLPNDAEMMETYGVSRTVLREALKTLESKGLVEARPKVGTRVSPTTRWSFFDPQVLHWHFDAKPNRQFYESLYDVRMALEVSAARKAATRRTAEQMRILKYWLHQMDGAGDNIEQFGLAIVEIHRALTESSGNVLFRSVVGVVELCVALSLSQDNDREQHCVASLATHQSLVEALDHAQVDEAATLVAQSIALDHQRALRFA